MINWKDSGSRMERLVPDAIVNLSNYQLTLEESELLRYGLKHSIIPKQLNNDKLKYEVKKLFRLMWEIMTSLDWLLLWSKSYKI